MSLDHDHLESEGDEDTTTTTEQGQSSIDFTALNLDQVEQLFLSGDASSEFSSSSVNSELRAQLKTNEDDIFDDDPLVQTVRHIVFEDSLLNNDFAAKQVYDVWKRKPSDT